MIAYLDASIILRLVLGEPHQLAEWPTVSKAVASALTEVECLRTLDRLERQGLLTINDLAVRRAGVYRLLEAVEIVDVSRSVLQRASESFATPLGTLDAIHLATALAWRSQGQRALVMATHDKALGTASRALGLEVIGVAPHA